MILRILAGWSFSDVFRWSLSRSEMVKHECPENPGKGVSGPNREVDLAGHDDKGHPNGHDGDKARVLGQLGEVLSIEEVVSLFQNWNLCSCRIRCNPSDACSVWLKVKDWNLDGAAKNGQQQPKCRHNNNQADLGDTQPRWNPGKGNQHADCLSEPSEPPKPESFERLLDRLSGNNWT